MWESLHKKDASTKGGRMIIISFIIGCLFGWYIAYRIYTPTRTQINKKGSTGIQIGTINLEEEE